MVGWPFATFLAPLRAKGLEAWPHGRLLHSKTLCGLVVPEHDLMAGRYTQSPTVG